jgi:hypothetical protein
MKNAIKVLVALLITSLSVLAASNDDQIDKIDSNSQVFVFKVDREFKGGRIEVLSAEGKRVTAQRLMRRKIVIDFCDVKTGVYTIVVTKDDQVKEFEFVKK